MPLGDKGIVPVSHAPADSSNPTSQSHRSDAELVRQMQQPAQRTAAFEVLFARHYAQVWRVLYRLLGSHDDTDDLVQETFLVLYQQPPRLQTDESLVPWLCRVGLNRGYNWLRGQRRRQQRERASDPPLASTPDPAVLLLRHEERQQVQHALLRLPERQSRILLLRYGGLSYAEIAAAVGVAAGSVGTLLARAERAFLARYAELEPARDPADQAHQVPRSLL